MALRGAAARRYAQAIFDIAKESNSLDKWLADLKTINQIFGGQEAVTALEDPSTSVEDVRRIVGEHVAAGRVSQMAVNLVYMLVDRHRLVLLPQVFESFLNMYNKEKGIVVADVTSAVPLDEAHQQRVQQQLSRITGKAVELRMHEDPRILGGIIARIGDELIDASVATRLATLAQRLA